MALPRPREKKYNNDMPQGRFVHSPIELISNCKKKGNPWVFVNRLSNSPTQFYKSLNFKKQDRDKVSFPTTAPPTTKFLPISVTAMVHSTYPKRNKNIRPMATAKLFLNTIFLFLLILYMTMRNTSSIAVNFKGSNFRVQLIYSK